MTLADLIARAGANDRVLETQSHRLRLADFERASALAEGLDDLVGRSVVLHVRDMALAAAALIDLDGRARRVVLCPPYWGPETVALVAAKAEAEAIVHDREAAPLDLPMAAAGSLPLRPRSSALPRDHATEWVLPTSGTSGPPKLVIHTLVSLTGAIADAPKQEWATFYDIRRYGGLQIFLRALSGAGSLRMNDPDESIEAFLARLGAAGVTHVTGTPSHWRMVLMSGKAGRIDPEYVRLSGEIADDAILEDLKAQYPKAQIDHAYASTEAGVAFTVGDGRAGFPAEWIGRPGPVTLRVVDGVLQIRSDRRALQFLGSDAPRVADDEGFVDTGDMLELRDDRYLFVGRRGGIINVGGSKVHPEEVEALINAHPAVRASRAFGRRNPFTGAAVVADVVLHPDAGAVAGVERETIEREIMDAFRERLPPYMAPARLRFVSELPMTDGGKLLRNG
jgi:acyl-coenzyme A synthetase/AMP-(fatty) acid ligase